MRKSYTILRKYDYNNIMKKISLNLHFQDHYDNQVASGVLDYIKNKADWEINGEGYWFHHTKEKVDGIIARIESEKDLKKYEAFNIPVVDIAGAFVSKNISTVRNDDWDTGVRSGRYFIDIGVTNFAFCQVSNVGWSNERINGFCSGAGIVRHKIPVFFQSLDWWKQLYNNETPELDKWLSSLSFPVGIFCSNDLCAMKVSYSCRKLGIKIPSQVSLMGVDNEEILCMLSKPTITSMALQLKEIGYEAARVLENIFEKKVSGRYVCRISPLEVIERDSTAVFFKDDPVVEKAVRLIKKNAKFGFCVNDVIDKIPCSRRSLELHFKKALNMTIFEYIVKQRLEESVNLLKNTEKSIKVVGQECGFGSIQRFHYVFKKHFDMTPYEYRKKNVSKNNI